MFQENTVHALYPAANTLRGCYYFSSYWRSWDIIIKAENGCWVVENVASGERRKHSTPLKLEGLSPCHLISSNYRSIRDILDAIKEVRKEYNWSF